MWQGTKNSNVLQFCSKEAKQVCITDLIMRNASFFFVNIQALIVSTHVDIIQQNTVNTRQADGLVLRVRPRHKSMEMNRLTLSAC